MLKGSVVRDEGGGAGGDKMAECRGRNESITDSSQSTHHSADIRPHPLPVLITVHSIRFLVFLIKEELYEVTKYSTDNR